MSQSKKSQKRVTKEVVDLMKRIRPGDNIKYLTPERSAHKEGLYVTETSIDKNRRQIFSKAEGGGTYLLVDKGFNDDTNPAIYHINSSNERTRRGTLESLKIIAGKKSF